MSLSASPPMGTAVYCWRNVRKANSRQAIRLLAASSQNRQELQHAAELGVDFAVLSPAQSHPGAPTPGWEYFAELCLDMPMPEFTLGGMRLDLLETAQTHSAHGVSLLSGIWLPTGTD